MPGEDISSHHINKTYAGTSFSAVMLTGIVAQIKATDKDINNEDLQKTLISMTENNDYNIFVGYGTPKFN
jgi:hypothetical protein